MLQYIIDKIKTSYPNLLNLKTKSDERISYKPVEKLKRTRTPPIFADFNTVSDKTAKIFWIPPMMKDEIKNNIEKILKKSLRNKFKHYVPESSSMLFHIRLLGKDKLALFSFIHSSNTNFGTTTFEPIALELARSKFKTVLKQVNVGLCISDESQREIQNIIDKISTANIKPNKYDENRKNKKSM